MLQYTSRQHRKMMDASEYALRTAAESATRGDARIASTIVHDSNRYREWERRHADLLLPVAQHRNNRRLLVALRDAQVKLVHRRALFRYLQTNEVRGDLRRRLFRLFHATLDFDDAILAEHQQYMLAVSSRISAEHIVDFMHDTNSKRLLARYEQLYANYFEMKCYVALAQENNSIAMVRPMLLDAQKKLHLVRQRIDAEPPLINGSSFEQREALARSGRYKALNYLVA